VELDGVDGDDEGPSDLLVGQPLDGEVGDAALGRGEPARGGRLAGSDQRRVMSSGDLDRLPLQERPLWTDGGRRLVFEGGSPGDAAVYTVAADGTDLRRTGSSKAGAATKISLHGVSRSYPGLDPRDMVLTALRDNGGELKLITWDTNLVNP